MKSHILTLFLLISSFLGYSQNDFSEEKDYQDMGFEFFIGGNSQTYAGNHIVTVTLKDTTNYESGMIIHNLTKGSAIPT